LARLIPWPGDGSRLDGPVAVDATDRLLLAEAQKRIVKLGTGDVTVIGDRFGALTIGALALGATGVRLHCDAITAERAVNVNLERLFGNSPLLSALRGAEHEDVLPNGLPLRQNVGGGRVAVKEALSAELVQGTRLVLWQLPRSLAELQEVAELIAREAASDVVVLAGGRVKHMSPAMNDVLGACFTKVHATLARGKSRVLIASGVHPAARIASPSFPVTARLRDAELLAAAFPATSADIVAEGLVVAAHGGVFAGAGLDLGTRALLGTANRWPSYRDALDLGCGSGLLATVLALRNPSAQVTASDRSAAAIASAFWTGQANGVAERVIITRDDAGASLPDAAFDLVLCNPPFHDRAALSTDAAHRMFGAAARVLRPGGELWCVYNSGLRYRPALERIIGPTTQEARDPRFTVTRSVSDPRPSPR